MIAFKSSKNLQEIIGGHTVKEVKVFRKNLARLNGKSTPCSSTRPSLCCTQILNTNNYESANKNNVWCIPQTNLQKSMCYLFNGMHIMQNPIRWKIRDPFNLWLNNHRKDPSNPKAVPACNHFKIHGHNFMKHAKFTLITEISNVSKDTLRLRLNGEIFGSLNSKHLLQRD